MPNTVRSLQVSKIRTANYPGGKLIIEKQLKDSEGYSKFIVSYPSDDLKIYALLTIPHPNSHSRSNRESTKLPLILFNRGFVDPAQYTIDHQYMRYIDYLARAGFAIFKSDYRGIGESEGKPASVLSSENAADVLNSLASLQLFCHSEAKRKKRRGTKAHSEGSPKNLGVLHSDAQDDKEKMLHDDIIIDFSRVGTFGHSMGGMISLQCMLANPKIKAGVIWAGFMIPYADVIERWLSSPLERQKDRAKILLKTFGDPKKNPQAWHDISPFYFTQDLPGPIQLHHGLKDRIVPVADSQRFQEQLIKHHKDGGLFLYENGGHNLNEPNILPQAMQNTIEFFKKKLF